MIKVCLLFLFTLLASSQGLANEPVMGWHWYHDPVQEKKDKKREISPLVNAFNQLSPTQQLKILQKATNNLKAKAVLSGKVSDISSYKQAQDFWIERATQFSIGWEKMLLVRPDLDYSLVFSNENALASVTQRGKHGREKSAVQKLSKENGLLLFYRGKDKGDQLFARIISRYAKKNKFSLIPISIDGVIFPAFGSNHQTHGLEKAEALGVNYFPALVLVNPKNNQYEVVSYGFKSENELSDRLLKINDGWRAEF
jgi:conjugal transfer pilus assembly protein TraF